MSKSMVLMPRVSEKAYGLSQTNNVYVFLVPVDANKLMIKQAVSAQFEVTVMAVNVINNKGKAKRTVRRGGRTIMGRRSDIRKAYVTIKAGQSIPVFAAVEDDEKKANAAKPTKSSRSPRVKKGDK